MPTARRTSGNGARAPEKRGDRIRADIERAILLGKLVPGEKLDEEALARRQGYARPGETVYTFRNRKQP